MDMENNQNQATQSTSEPAAGSVETTAKSSLGISQTAALILAYIFGWIGGLIFMLAEKDNKFIKFHATQSLISDIAAIVILGIVTGILGAIGTAISLATLNFGIAAIFALLCSLIWLAYLVLVIYMIYKAVKGVKYKLPIIGNIAENIVK
jgi:uncharacterized membrane protein